MITDQRCAYGKKYVSFLPAVGPKNGARSVLKSCRYEQKLSLTKKNYKNRL